MKVIDTPRTGKIGKSWPTCRPLDSATAPTASRATPKPPPRAARAIFGSSSRGWGLKLTEHQRQHWVAPPRQVPSHPSLAQYSHLSGQQLCVKINSTLRCVGQAPVAEPPAPVVFSPNPVGELTIDYDEAGNVRLLLAVGAGGGRHHALRPGAVQRGRMKHRRVNYLGLLGPATNGQCDITARISPGLANPAPGKRSLSSPASTRTAGKPRTT